MLTFSVVIPLYNKEQYVQRAVESVLAQTYSDFELIVINDGSTDRSVENINQYKDARLRIIHQKNAGETAARNRGIQEAKNNLIAFLDADDEWLPDFLQTINRLVNKFPEAGAYATAYKIIQPNGAEKIMAFKGMPADPWEGILPNYFESVSEGPVPFNASSVCISKHAFAEVGNFPEKVLLLGELDMWIRIALKYPIAYSTQKRATYHKEAENRACNIFLLNLDEVPVKKTLQKAIENNEVDPKFIPFINHFIAKQTYYDAVRFLLANETVEARRRARTIKTQRMGLMTKKLGVIILSYLPYPFIKIISKLIEKIK
jgi:glycosyltransferase involved in cell wall biosynthesis